MYSALHFATMTDAQLLKYAKLQGVDERFTNDFLHKIIIQTVAREKSRRKQYRIIHKFFRSIPIASLHGDTSADVFVKFIKALSDYFVEDDSDDEIFKMDDIY